MIIKKTNINKIKEFWEKNPLYDGEIKSIYNKRYFDTIYNIFKNDVYAGEIDKKLIPKNINKKKIFRLRFWSRTLCKIFL